MKLSAVLPVLCVHALNEMLIDTDPGIDDVMTFLMALGNPTVNVRAITMTYGNTVLKNVARNLCSVFHALDLQAKATGKEWYRHNDKPRLALGASKPLKGALKTAGYFHGVDGLGNLTLSHPELIATDFKAFFAHDFDKETKESSSRRTTAATRRKRKISSRFTVSPFDAVDEILFQLKSLPPFTLTIVALGPLTNIARAVKKDPVTMSRAKRIVVMGGALLVPGNITPLAEFNFYADPFSANVVFNATRGFNRKKQRMLYQSRNLSITKPLPLHVTLVPVNITHTTLMTRENMEAHLAPIQGQPLPTFYTSMLVIPLKKSDKIRGLALHDPLAMGVALDLIRPKPITKRYAIRVIEESKITRGLCVVDLRPKAKSRPRGNQISVEVVTSVGDPTKFQFKLLEASFPQLQDRTKAYNSYRK